METQDVLACLGRSRVFQSISAEKLGGIREAGTTLHFAEGAEVISEGMPNVRLYVVIAGELDVVLAKNPQRLSRVRLNALGSGDCIGEYSFIDERLTSASVIATRETDVWAIERQDLERLLDADPELGSVVYKNLLVLLVNRLRQEIQDVDVFRPL